MLSTKYRCSIIRGRGVGKTLGFPTFNLKIPSVFSLPSGIYACWVWINRRRYAGALHFGPRPAFHDSSPSLEIFVLDFSPNYPVTQLTFQPVKRLRPVRNFSSPAALARQISRDVELVRATLN